MAIDGEMSAKSSKLIWAKVRFKSSLSIGLKGLLIVNLNGAGQFGEPILVWNQRGLRPEDEIEKNSKKTRLASCSYKLDEPSPTGEQHRILELWKQRCREVSLIPTMFKYTEEEPGKYDSVTSFFEYDDPKNGLS